MRRIGGLIALSCAPLAVAALFCLPAYADDQAALAALRQGGHVALMRHADAPGGAGDPPGFKLDDCATQRNLGDTGKQDAKAIGDRLGSAGVSFAKVLSSPWCRCIEMAKLMRAGNVEIADTFSNAFTERGRREELAQGARRIVAEWKGPGSLLIVTHGANIQAVTGYNPLQGEIVVVSGGETQMREIGRIAPPRH